MYVNSKGGSDRHHLAQCPLNTLLSRQSEYVMSHLVYNMTKAIASLYCVPI